MAVAPVHQTLLTYKNSGGTFDTANVSITSDTEINTVIALTDPATNVEWDGAVYAFAAVASYYVKASTHVTVKVNSTGSPAQTIELQAGEPFTWNNKSGLTNGLTADSTKWYLTTHGANASVAVTILVDRTP